MTISENLNKLLSILAVVLIIFVGVRAYNGIIESKYIGNDVYPNRVITVSGTGEVFAKPDIAKISVSVVKTAKTVIEAQAQHTESINKVVKFLKDSGIDEKDIKTTNYNIYPQYDYTHDSGQVFKGYEISQSLDVKIRKIDEAGKIISGVTENGANQIGGVNFVIDDEDSLKRDAREIAINEAKEKAKQLAKDLHVDLERLISFNESNGGMMYNTFKGEGMGGDIGPMSAPSIPAGENKISVSVNLTYEIK